MRPGPRLVPALWLLCAAALPVALWPPFVWVVMAAAGTAATPLFFRLFDRIYGSLNYPQFSETSFRPDREIKRGRM